MPMRVVTFAALALVLAAAAGCSSLPFVGGGPPRNLSEVGGIVEVVAEGRPLVWLDSETMLYSTRLEIARIRVDGTGYHRLDSSMSPRLWLLSPDETQLAYVVPQDPEVLKVARVDGSRVSVLATGVAFESLVWSHDGSRIAFIEGPRDGPRPYMVTSLALNRSPPGPAGPTGITSDEFDVLARPYTLLRLREGQKVGPWGVGWGAPGEAFLEWNDEACRDLVLSPDPKYAACSHVVPHEFASELTESSLAVIHVR